MINPYNRLGAAASLLAIVTARNRKTMARYSEHDTSKIYQAAEAFRDNCLLRDGSLLFSDASVWRPDVLDSIHQAFVATPDESRRNFMLKFKDQVGKAGQDVTRLAAEILSVYFLFPSKSTVGGLSSRT